MQVTLTGQHIDVGNALRSHVEDVLAATIDKYFGEAIEANVVISREAFRLRADVSIHIGKGIFVRAHEEADDAYAAFDVAVAHLAKRLRRYKRRLRDYHNARTGLTRSACRNTSSQRLARRMRKAPEGRPMRAKARSSSRRIRRRSRT